MINVSLETIYYLVMILGGIAAFIKWVYDLGYKHGKRDAKNAKK